MKKIAIIGLLALSLSFQACSDAEPEAFSLDWLERVYQVAKEKQDCGLLSRELDHYCDKYENVLRRDVKDIMGDRVVRADYLRKVREYVYKIEQASREQNSCLTPNLKDEIDDCDEIFDRWLRD